jgi:CHASE2 domain-containing sensor protein
LQAAPSLEGIKQHTFSLGPMPKGAYQEVIEGPARRLGNRRALEIEPQLTSALLTDIEAGGAKDALPLLAFTLERLYLEYGGDGDLKLSEYEQLGRIKGAIEAAVERAFSAADSDPTIPRDRQPRLALLRRGLIPWLAGIDPDTAAPRRRVARLSEIPTEARPLIKLLIEQRLLTTDVARGTGEITIEPAHEVLLRQWGLLEGWLAEDFGDLAALDGLRRATRDWAANGKLDAWLIHTGPRLEQAERVAGRKEFAAFVEPTESSYLAAARVAEDVRQRARLRRLRRDLFLSGILAYGPLAAALIAVLALFYAPSKERIESLMHWPHDWRAVLLADRVSNRYEDIVVVLFDPATFNDAVVSPIPRDTYAQLIRVLDAMSPRAIGLDMYFVASQDSEKDLLFLDALRSAKSPIVLGAIEADNLDQFHKDFQQQFLSSSGRPAGLLGLDYDGDHVIRRTRTSSESASKEGFAHSVARAADATLKGADQSLEFAPIAWALGPNHNEPFLTISAKDLLPGADQARLGELQRLIAGKIVLIGIDMPNSDRHDTPLSASTGDKMLGVMVHAQILAQLLDGRYLTELAATPRRALLFVVALFGFCLGWVAKPRLSGLLTITIATGILVALDAASYSFLRTALPVGLALYLWFVAIVAAWGLARLIGRNHILSRLARSTE